MMSMPQRIMKRRTMSDTSEQTATTAIDWPDEVIALLEQQHALVDRLSDLAARQAQLIEDARTDALLGLLTERQHVIEQFAATQQRIGSLTGDLDARLHGVDDEQGTRIRTLIAEIGDRLARVMKSDEADQQRLEAVRDQVREQRTSVDAQRTARRAYVRRDGAANRFADERG
jgi:septal ring factor EnvC (AmiA/AmiB activator)